MMMKVLLHADRGWPMAKDSYQRAPVSSCPKHNSTMTPDPSWELHGDEHRKNACEGGSVERQWLIWGV